MALDLISAKKDYLLDQIQSAVKELQKEQYSCNTPQANPIANGHSELQRLCEHLDHVLLHGIKVIDTGYWSYVVEYTRKDELHLIQHLTSVSTDLGRGRSWLYQALNENILENYLRLFSENKILLEKHYRQEALMRDEQRVPVLLTIAAGLEYIVFELTIDCEYFDYGAFTPSKAGLLNIGPLTPTQLASLHNCHIAKRDKERIAPTEQAPPPEDNKTEDSKDDTKDPLSASAHSVVSKLKSLFSRSPSNDTIDFSVSNDYHDMESQSVLGSKTNAFQDSPGPSSHQGVAETIASKARSVKEFTVTRAAAAKIKAADMLNRAASLFSDLQSSSAEKEFAAVKAQTVAVARVRTRSECGETGVTESQGLSLRDEDGDFYQMSRMARIEKVMEGGGDGNGEVSVAGRHLDQTSEEETMVKLEVKHLVTKPVKSRKKKRKKKSKCDQEASKTPDSDSLSVCTNPGDSQIFGVISDADPSVSGVTESLSSPNEEPQEFVSEVTQPISNNRTISEETEADKIEKEEIHEEVDELEERGENSVSEENGHLAQQKQEPVSPVPTTVDESSCDCHKEEEDQSDHIDEVSIAGNGVPNPASLLQKNGIAEDINQVTESGSDDADGSHVSDRVERQQSLEGDTVENTSSAICLDVDVESDEQVAKEIRENETEGNPEYLEGGRPFRCSLAACHHPSEDIEIDQNLQLMLRLEVLEKEEESLIKLLNVLLCYGKSDYQSAYILLTDNAIYALSKDGTGGRFDSLQHWRYESVSHLEVSFNWQTVSIVDEKFRTWVIILANELVARLLVDTIQSTMAANLSLHPLVILTSDEARIEAIHKVIFKSTKKYKSLPVLHYSLINWEPIGDAPGPIGYRGALNEQAVMEGKLMVQSSILTFSFWQEGYFVLDIRKGLMIHYGSKATRDYKNIYSLRAGKCGGVHRRSDIDKPNAFEIISVDKGDSLILAAPNPEAAAEWLQAVCETVAGPGTGADEPQTRYVACSLFVLPLKIYLFHEYHTGQLPELLAHCDISEISSVCYDPDCPSYSLLNFEFSDMGKSGWWLVFFSSEYELGKFEECLARAWKDLFQTALPFVPIKEHRLRDRAHETVTLLSSSMQRNDSVTRGREQSDIH